MFLSKNYYRSSFFFISFFLPCVFRKSESYEVGRTGVFVSGWLSSSQRQKVMQLKKLSADDFYSQCVRST